MSAVDSFDTWRKFVRRCWWQFDGEAERIASQALGVINGLGLNTAAAQDTRRSARRRILALKTRVLIRLDRAALKYFYDRPD